MFSKLQKQWKNYRINYYMEVFKRLGMFDNSAEQSENKSHQEALTIMVSGFINELSSKYKKQLSDTEIKTFDEKSEDFSTTSPFWNSDMTENPHHSEKISDTLRPRPFGNHIWNWAAFFFGPFWGIAKYGQNFLPDFLLFFALAACAGISGISIFKSFPVNALLFIYMILHGYFGNYVYKCIAKREVEEGAHVIARYFSFLPEMDANKLVEYTEKIGKRVRKKYPQSLIINEENVHDYLERRPYSGAEVIQSILGILFLIFLKLIK